MVDPPRVHHREMGVLTEEQVRVLLAAAAGERLEALYVLAHATGMRLGELLALKWSGVDLEEATLQVRSTLQRTKAGYTFADPKTARSRRAVALSATAVEALRRHRIRQAKERLQLGEVWSNLDLVFTDEVGSPLDGISVLRYAFHPLLKRAGLPIIRFHDLRHTAATMLLGRGVNVKVVSEMLGHSHISITLSLYGHVLPHMQREAAAAMDAVFEQREPDVGVKIGVKRGKRGQRQVGTE
jgi:integrase